MCLEDTGISMTVESVNLLLFVTYYVNKRDDDNNSITSFLPELWRQAYDTPVTPLRWAIIDQYILHAHCVNSWNTRISYCLNS